MRCETCEAQQQQLLKDGDGSQVICTCLEDNVDFPSEAEMIGEFPIEEEFESSANAISWRNVERNVTLKIVEIVQQPTRNGESTILVLKKRDGSIIRTWTTKLIDGKLKSMKSDDGRCKYILSCGERTAEKSGNKYYDFKIICR